MSPFPPPFTDDGKTLAQWMAQYPHDKRYLPILAALEQHAARS